MKDGHDRFLLKDSIPGVYHLTAAIKLSGFISLANKSSCSK